MVAKTSILKELETIYGKSGNQLYVLYGRTDSEKEQLLKAFLSNKKYFYYRSRQASEQEQRNQMETEIRQKFSANITKHSYDEFFNRIKSGDASKLVVVIDEFQLIAKKDVSFMESIEKLRMKRLYPGPVLILLCSSSVAWVEQEMPAALGGQSKRIDGKIQIHSLNFLEVVRAFPQYQVSDCIRTYGVIGGVAGYINHWDQRKDLKTNICRNILNRNGYMHRAAEQLIAAELRELSVYETILYYIASGYDKLNELHLKTGYSRAKISVYMKNLGTFHLVEKETSFETGGWENTKKAVYRLKDNYVNFWFRFVYPHLSELYMTSPEQFYDAYIAPGIDEYLERYFKEVCMEYVGLLNLVGKLPMKIHKMGTWIGKEGNIDIIAQNSVRENIVGYCNWNQPEFTMEMKEALLKSMKQAKIDAEYFFLFSAKGFSEEIKKLAEEDTRYILVDMNEL